MSPQIKVRGVEPKLSALRRSMWDIYEQRRRFATFAAAVLALAMGYHVVFGQNGLTAYQKKKDESKVLATRLQALRDENEALKGHVDRLKNDPGAIEHQAREGLHYTRPGEVIVTLPAEPLKNSEKK